MMNYFLTIGSPQLILILLILIPTVIAFIDILKNEFTGNNKVIWLLFILLGSFFGVLLYFMIGRKQKVSATHKKS